MKKVLPLVALTAACVALFLLFTPARKAQAQQTTTVFIGDGAARGERVTNGTPNTVVYVDVTESNPGIVQYSFTQAGTYSNSIRLTINLDSTGTGSAGYYAKYFQVGQTTETIYSPTLGIYAGDSGTTYNVLNPATGVTKIQYQKDGVFVDVPATLNVLKGDTVTFQAIPSPAGSVFRPFDPGWSGTSGATGAGGPTTATFGTLSKNSKDYKTVIATINSNGANNTANVIVGNGVKSIDFEAIDPSSVIDDNPNTGGGKRIFPDKTSPSDTVDRRKVRVKAQTTFGSGQTIFFKSFDLDDPSTDAAPVDNNGSAGNDNRGGQGTAQQFGILSVVGGSGTTNSVSAATDANGLATVELTVTMQPGDNFMVAASHDSTYLNGLTVSGVTLKDSGGVTVGSGTVKAKSSLMLTVWRKLNLEVDSMGLVAGNQVTGIIQNAVTNAAANTTDLTVNQSLEVNRFENGLLTVAGAGYSVVSNTANVITVSGAAAPPIGSTFTLVDDDDFNSDNAGSLHGDEGEDVEPIQPSNMFATTFRLMQESDNPSENVFAPAYIRPSYSWASNAGYDNNNVSFQLNVTDTATAVDQQLAQGQNSSGSESSSFWVVYVQLGYQHQADQDNDPDAEPQATTGIGGSWTGGIDTYSGTIPRGADGSMIYIEVQRDVELHSGIVRLIRTVPHEVGHQFGLQGDDAANSYGIMSYGNDLQFVPAHLNILRWRVSSPGKP